MPPTSHADLSALIDPSSYRCGASIPEILYRTKRFGTEWPLLNHWHRPRYPIPAFFIHLNGINENLLDFGYIYPPPRFPSLHSSTEPPFTHHSRHKTSTMKTAAIVLTVSLALAASASAAPKAEVAKGGAVVDAVCYHGSYCSTGWRGQCEKYCQDNGGFAFMSSSGCWFFAKKCCCNKA
jgi:hypothetical protein